MLTILAANLITKANSWGLKTHQLALHMAPLLHSTITEGSHKTCESAENVCQLCNQFW